MNRREYICWACCHVSMSKDYKPQWPNKFSDTLSQDTLSLSDLAFTRFTDGSSI
jgi:hypothetical protein